MSIFFDEARVQAGHGRKALHSGVVSIVARGINAIVQVGSILLLARLLSPEDYGLVSMVLALTGFASVFVDFGTRDAVVQRSQISRVEISALFWLTLLLGALMTSIVAASGPLIAKFYAEPRLTAIVLVSSLTFVTSALSCQHHALLRRAMMFQQVAFIEIGANLLSTGLAVVIALCHYGYWALVLKPILQYMLTAIGVWSVCRWLPGRAKLTSGVKEMVKFGLHLLGFSMTDFAGANMDRAALGRRSGAASLGYYQNAFLVYDNLLGLTFPLHSVAVAALSKLRDNPAELKRLWAKALATLAFYAMPAFGLIAVISQDLIVLVLGAKWSRAGLLLGVLALRGIPHVVERTLGWLHVSAGRPDRWMRWGVVSTCVHALALACGLPFGAIGVVWAYVLAMFVLFIPAIAFAGRPLRIGASDCVRAVKPQFVAALVAAAVTFALKRGFPGEMPRLLRIATLCTLYLGAYLGVVVGLFRLFAPVQVALSLISDYLPTRLAGFGLGKLFGRARTSQP